MELGGNKNAQAFYEEHAMFKDGKPDHEAALNRRQNADLAAKVDTMIKQQKA